MKTLYEWLNEKVDSHSILDSKSAKEDCKNETGFKLDWPEHTKKQTVNAIKARGLGGTINGPDDMLFSSGFEIAEYVARIYCDNFYSSKFGRGSRFRECMAEIKRVDPQLETV